MQLQKITLLHDTAVWQALKMLWVVSELIQNLDKQDVTTHDAVVFKEISPVRIKLVTDFEPISKILCSYSYLTYVCQHFAGKFAMPVTSNIVCVFEFQSVKMSLIQPIPSISQVHETET